MDTPFVYHHRQSIRRWNRDYSQSCLYFVTICVQDRRRILSEIKDNQVVLSDIGSMVNDLLLQLQDRFIGLYVDRYVIMPDHIHVIIRTISNEEKITQLSQVIGALKSLTTNEYIKGVNDKRWPPYEKRFWQRNYHEHVIRCAKDYERIVEYIAQNPTRWNLSEKEPTI